MSAPIPLAVYLHVPWCVRKCPYCDFNSHALDGALPTDAFVARLREDLAAQREACGDRPVHSVFFGGGTPSLLEPGAVAAILAALDDGLNLSSDAEVTLEANPGTLEAGRFAGFRAAGVNRLSIGVQSFDDGALTRLGRIHDGAAALEAAETARRAGFERINLDLMHGLPGQDSDAALDDLRRALDFDPGHLSWYQLTIEPNTAFHSAPPALPDIDVLADIEAEGFELLAGAGYDRYEVSAFARPGQTCRHNLNYWTFGDYLGLGPGAHGKLTRQDQGQLQVVRRRRTRTPADYLAAGPLRLLEETVSPDALPGEFMLNALRLVDGVASDCFSARTGQPLQALEPDLTALREQGLLRADRLATTDTGLRFLDRVVARFLA